MWQQLTHGRCHIGIHRYCVRSHFWVRFCDLQKQNGANFNYSSYIMYPGLSDMASRWFQYDFLCCTSSPGCISDRAWYLRMSGPWKSWVLHKSRSPARCRYPLYDIFNQMLSNRFSHSIHCPFFRGCYESVCPSQFPMLEPWFLSAAVEYSWRGALISRLMCWKSAFQKWVPILSWLDQLSPGHMVLVLVNVFVCTCLPMCTHEGQIFVVVLVYVFVCTCLPMCIHGGQMLTLSAFLYYTLPFLYYCGRVCHWTWSPLFQLDWVASKPVMSAYLQSCPWAASYK